MSEELSEMTIKGYEKIDKTAKATATSALIYVPRAWAGCRVAVIRLDELKEDV